MFAAIKVSVARGSCTPVLTKKQRAKRKKRSYNKRKAGRRE
jgi:hypothetical protein